MSAPEAVHPTPRPEGALKRLGRRLLGANAVGGFIRATTLRRRLKPYAGEFGRVLEAGCGSGLNLALVRSFAPNASLAGCDIYESELAKARTRVPGAEFFQADLTRWEGDASYDLVLNVDVLEHIADYKAALRMMASCLRPGGLLALHTPNEEQRRLLPIRRVQQHWQDDHEREGFDLDALAADFAEAGLDVIHKERTVGTIGAIVWELDFLCRGLKPLNYLFLPLWKLVALADIGSDHPRGNGLLLLARKRAG
jgi:SAM-dependent methyltransferase